MTIPDSSLSSWLQRLVLVLLATLAGCGTFEEKRIAQLLHEKGFGSRADGDATYEDYIGGLDHVQFLIDLADLKRPGLERLIELTAQQPLGLDGTIHVPYVGAVYVLGRTEVEATALVQGLLRTQLSFDIDLQVRILNSTKFFYAVGEVQQRGPVQLIPDMTFFQAMFRVGWTNFGNLGRIYLVRPDAETPLVVDINFREMLTTGLTTANLQMREHDIIYIPPTFLGLIGRLLERVTEPVGLAVRTLLGVAQIRTSYEVVSGQRDAAYFRF